MQLVESWIEALHGILHDDPLQVDDIRIGVFYTAAKLSTGHVGVAFTPRDLNDSVCCPHSAAEAPAAGRLAGQAAWTLARYALAAVALRRAVGVAVLNALSALAMQRHGIQGGQMIVGLDALQAAEVGPSDRVAMVGGFVPFIKALKGHVAALSIIDKHKEALKPDELPCWRAPHQAPDVLARSDVVIITGSALVEGGIDALLRAASNARRVILAGPTASPWPPPFFAYGIDVLGGLRVRDGEKILQLVSEGGSGYFFAQAAEKVCVIATKSGRISQD